MAIQAPLVKNYQIIAFQYILSKQKISKVRQTRLQLCITYLKNFFIQKTESN